MAVPGQIIGGKYEILKLVKTGGMSKVYVAMDKNLNKQWAVKEIDKNKNNIDVESAFKEANIMKDLDHPNIVRITDIFDAGNCIYLVEDYIDGENLRDYVKKRGEQPQEVVVSWGVQLCRALDYLHNMKPPIIYRDMKPENVMRKSDGTIRVIDFGIAREKKLDISEDNLGTHGYAAPEQYEGVSDARSDIFSLGVTMFNLLTGKDPRKTDSYSIRHWNPQLSTGLDAILQKCTARDPNERYQTCEELMMALKHFEEYDIQYIVRQKIKLRRFLFSIALTAIFLCVGIVGLVMRTLVDNADYDRNMELAEDTSMSADKRIELYSKAIEIKPGKSEPYKQMLEVFKLDGSFDVEEESIFKNYLNENLSALKENKEKYAELAYDIGTIYWFYYNYGKNDSNESDGTSSDEINESNQITRMTSSIHWFEEVISYGGKSSSDYVSSEIFKEIGEFNRDINLYVAEAKEGEKYKEYFGKIKKLLQIVESEKDELIILEVYRLEQNSLETYSRKFKKDGVSKGDVVALYNDVYAALKMDRSEEGYIEATEDKTKKIKDALLGRFGLTEENDEENNSGIIEVGTNYVRAAIENAYGSIDVEDGE